MNKIGEDELGYLPCYLNTTRITPHRIVAAYLASAIPVL